MMMNRRLVWNFEINSDNPLQLPGSESPSPDSNRWESRFFWPGDEIITLHGLSDHFRELSRYEIIHKEDTYFLLPNEAFNFKLRKDRLFYKPLLVKESDAVAYGKKITLDDQPPAIRLPGFGSQTIDTILSRIKSEGVRLTVEKEALTYSFDTTPRCKFELAWLRVLNKNFFTVSIESKAFPIVAAIRKQMIQNKIASDYITFLRGLTP